jgi:large subunit ribosomal protein L22
MKTYKAIAKNISYSPYKLRPIADVIRGKSAEYALNWLDIYRNKRSIPVKKVLESALANAVYQGTKHTYKDIIVSEIKVDQGLIRRYFEPGAQGKAIILRKRYCHITVVVSLKKESSSVKSKEEENRGNNGSKG